MIKSIFDELSANRGLPNFSFTDDGVCVLPLEHGAMHIQIREEAGDVVFTSPLGRVDKAVRGPVFAELLAANFAQNANSGGLLAMNEELDEVVYQYLLRAEGLTADRLGTTIENFMTVAEAWRLQLADSIESATALYEAGVDEDDDDATYVDDDSEEEEPVGSEQIIRL